MLFEMQIPNYILHLVKDSEMQNLTIIIFYNAEIPVSAKTDLYSFGGFSYRNTDAYAWTRDAEADGNVPSIYPNGFNPIENTEIKDFTFNNGLKFKLANWDLDVFNAFGSNQFMYNINNTVNATLGANSKTSFDAGGPSLLQKHHRFQCIKTF